MARKKSKRRDLGSAGVGPAPPASARVKRNDENFNIDCKVDEVKVKDAHGNGIVDGQLSRDMRMKLHFGEGHGSSTSSTHISNQMEIADQVYTSDVIQCVDESQPSSKMPNAKEVVIQSPAYCPTNTPPQQTYVTLISTPQKGVGAYAARKIPTGTLIISETPLLFMSRETETDPANVEAAFEQLDRPTKKTYLSLFNAEASGIGNIPSIYYSNCYNCDGYIKSHPSDNLFEKDQTKSGESGGSCLGELASRLNHSCIPNVQFSYDQKRNLMLFHAVKPIPRGKEICSNYLPNIAGTRDVRKRKLRLSYGFECDCDACSGRTEFWDKSDERRRLIARYKTRVVDAELSFGENRKAGYDRGENDSSNSLDMSKKQNEMERTVMVQDALDALDRLDILLAKEGLVGRPLALIHRQTITWLQRQQGKGGAKRIQMWKDKALDTHVVCFGSDSEMVKDLQRSWSLV